MAAARKGIEDGVPGKGKHTKAFSGLVWTRLARLRGLSFRAKLAFH